MFGLPLWLFSRVLPALALVGLLAFGVQTYNAKVSAAHVEAALKDERAKTEPIIKTLTDTVAARDKTIADKDAAAATELKRQTDAAASKQKLYDNLKAQNAKLSKQVIAAIPSPEFVADGVRNLTAGGDSTCAADSDYRRRLGAAIAQCETDLNTSLRATETAVDIATKAVAAARALKIDAGGAQTP